MSNYNFNEYKTKKDDIKLHTIFVNSSLEDEKLYEIEKIVEAVKLTRDLVNTPFSHLKAIDLANEAQKAGKESGFKTTIFTKNKIESLKMGGLLAVNQGSIDEPTFSILEWKPANTTNKKPIILVGKGVVYDTGGLSLKPTANSMDIMKVDMAGAGTVIGAMHAIANNNIQKYVIGLIPATDNRPSGNAYAPGDVVTMYDGTTVEVTVKDKKNATSNVYSRTVAQGNGSTFEMFLRMDNIKVLGGDYTVFVSSKGIAHFTNRDLAVEYFIALEPDSTYNES